MIKPTVGRIVWYWLNGQQDQPLAAIIACVHNDRCVNLSFFDELGDQHPQQSIVLIQDDEPKPDESYAEWMPYQKGQAAKQDVASIEKIAKVCYEVNRAYCIALCDESQVPWSEAPAWQKESAMIGVQFHINNPDSKPSDSHESWLEQKRAEGWNYGPIKDADQKTHSCFVPYEDLTTEQKAKDYMFLAVVRAML